MAITRATMTQTPDTPVPLPRVCFPQNPSEVISTPNAWSSLGDLWPYRLLVCLVGRTEIRKSILDNLSTEVFR